MPISVIEEAHKIRKAAESGPIGKRKTSFELYALLADCMRLGKYCASGTAHDEMRALVAQQPRGGGRRYVEKQSDGYVLVCRFVFANLKSEKAERSNASRYAAALRQADAIGIQPTELASRLSSDGGVNALFLRRPLAATSVTTKHIYLREAVTAQKGKPITLTIQREDDNSFSVLGVSNHHQ